jgi:hypothetical protein
MAFVIRLKSGHLPARQSVILDPRLQAGTTATNVKAKFRCPLPGKVEMSLLPCDFVSPAPKKKRSRDSGRMAMLMS